MPDRICISGLAAASRLGITTEEQAHAQRITVNLACFPKGGIAAAGDRIENTVDYAAVCRLVERVAAARPRNLIETLAEEIAAALLEAFPLESVEVEVRKYILENTDFVSVHIRRPAAGSPQP